jgi:hypothetical protein
MHDTLDLKKLEKKAFRATFQDGLLDIQMGGVVMSMAALASFDDSDAFPLLRFGLFLLGMMVTNLIFWGGKKFVTLPRLGQVKFGPRRKRRARTLALALGGIVLAQVAIVIGTVLLGQNPQWATALGLDQAGADLERLVVAVIAAMFVGPSVTLMAYFTDFTRGYYIALLMSLGAFCLVWFGQPLYLVAAGLLIAVPGAVLFARFLRQHPLPPAEVPRV